MLTQWVVKVLFPAILSLREAHSHKPAWLFSGATIRQFSRPVALKVTQPYAAFIRSGRHHPHLRQWETLQRVGVSRHFEVRAGHSN